MGSAINVTAAPLEKSVEQPTPATPLVITQSSFAGVDVTLPLPEPALVIDTTWLGMVNVAKTLTELYTSERTHSPVPEHFPDQPAKTLFPVGVAVRVTEFGGGPWSQIVEHAPLVSVPVMLQFKTWPDVPPVTVPAIAPTVDDDLWGDPADEDGARAIDDDTATIVKGLDATAKVSGPGRPNTGIAGQKRPLERLGYCTSHVPVVSPPGQIKQ